ncbi:MAG: T9SS type A sorting domain-containing protein [Oceanihabitans sp.]
MKKHFTLLLFITTIFTSLAQNFEKHIVVQEIVILWHPTYAIPLDFDNDGDMDIIHSEKWIISYSENINNNFDEWNNTNQFGITNSSYNFSSITTANIDNDTNKDIFISSSDNDVIGWFKNIDAAGDFGDLQIISTNADGAASVFVADLDNDGDMDAVSASSNDNKIAWYKNTDGLGNFGAEQIITTNANGASSVTGADLDNDGDIDIISASSNDNKIAWYENTDGQGNFGAEQIISTNALGATAVTVVDLDNDGDLDVISASSNDNKIAWYKNTDGLGSFGNQLVITTNAIGASAVTATDLDNDGDIDVISASYNDNKIAWYKNTDGQGNFGLEQIISSDASGANSVSFADMDNDGDMDVISSAYIIEEDVFQANRVSWYENDTIILSSEASSIINFAIFPIPSQNIIYIKTKSQIASITVFNELGQSIMKTKETNEINISTLNPGVYFIKVIDINNNFKVKKIVKK